MENVRFSAGALANLRVLELSNVIGEWCGKLMADMDANVIKIEPPGEGDPYRGMPQMPGWKDVGVNYIWVMAARNSCPPRT